MNCADCTSCPCPALCLQNDEALDVCAACGQSILTTPDDPPATLLCDVCLVSLERRRSLRPGTIAANPPQGGLF